MKYVIAEISGGTGNQLFKYAAARILSKKLGAELILDLSGFVGDGYERDYLLSNFEGPSQCKTFTILNRTTRALRRGAILFGSKLPSRFFRTLTDNQFFGQRTEEWEPIHSKMTYTQGNWMFSYCADSSIQTLIKDLQPLKGHGAVLPEIKSTKEPVAIHIRTYPDVKVKGNRLTTDIEYYEKSIRTIEKRLKEPNYFVFSDTKSSLLDRLLPSARTIYIPRSTAEDNTADLNDLLLMASCKHFITARSSFSWWAAYLSMQKWGYPNSQSPRLIFYPASTSTEKRRLPSFRTEA